MGYLYYKDGSSTIKILYIHLDTLNLKNKPKQLSYWGVVKH